MLYKKRNLSPGFYRAQMQLTNFSKPKMFHTPRQKLSVADMLSRSFTKAELHMNQLKHKQLPPQIYRLWSTTKQYPQTRTLPN